MRAEAVRTRLRAWLDRLSGSVRRERRSLVARLLGLLVAGAVLIYAVVNVGLWWSSTRLLQDSLERQAVQWLAELDALGTPLYFSRGGRPQADIEQRLRNFPEISFVRYYDAAGSHVLAEYNRDQVSLPPLTPEQIAKLAAPGADDARHLVDRAFLGGTYLRVLAPVNIRSLPADQLFGLRLDAAAPERVKIIGYLDIGFDARHYRDELMGSLLRGSAISGLLFVVVFFVVWRLIRRALAPLTALQEPLARLAAGHVDVEVRSDGDREIAAVGSALNTTVRALRERDAELRRLANQDPLTGLVNRAQFGRILDLELVRVREQGGESALYFIDLDHFKYVNDTLGHAAGDELLVQAAELLRARLRQDDVISRFGGDEFTVLARNVSRQAALDLAQSINELIRDAGLGNGEQAVRVGCSIGITLIGSSASTAEELFAQADMACYAAKARGRNRFHLYEPGDEDRHRMNSDIGWSQLIRQAIKDDRFHLAFQPIVPMRTGGEELFEVLVRLPHGNEVVTPDVFMPAAQRFGLLADIDRWVISHALQSLARARRGGREIGFSINLSGESFDDPALLGLIGRELERNQLPGAAVVFEITEQTAVRHLERVQQALRGLIALGCRFALDDFGSGFSSFSYLKHLPVHFIKIDGAFIRNLSRDAIDQTMVRAIVEVARALGKQTIAEFVQNKEAFELLRVIGVDFVQGDFLGHPSGHLAPRLRAAS
jgi:diguanylate cyclase (GGDEF)-like protein